jgi:hypothetical protein
MQWHYGQGTKLTLVQYRRDGGIFLQSVGEDDNGVIELPPHLLRAIGEALISAAAKEVA